MKIRACLETTDCLEILRAAGIAVPVPHLPNNTIWEHITTANGEPAVVIAQHSFRAQDGEDTDDVNGLTILITDNIPGAREGLEHYLNHTLGITTG